MQPSGNAKTSYLQLIRLPAWTWTLIITRLSLARTGRKCAAESTSRNIRAAHRWPSQPSPDSRVFDGHQQYRKPAHTSRQPRWPSLWSPICTRFGDKIWPVTEVCDQFDVVGLQMWNERFLTFLSLDRSRVDGVAGACRSHLPTPSVNFVSNTYIRGSSSVLSEGRVYATYTRRGYRCFAPTDYQLPMSIFAFLSNSCIASWEKISLPNMYAENCFYQTSQQLQQIIYWAFEL